MLLYCQKNKKKPGLHIAQRRELIYQHTAKRVKMHSFRADYLCNNLLYLRNISGKLNNEQFEIWLVIIAPLPKKKGYKLAHFFKTGSNSFIIVTIYCSTSGKLGVDAPLAHYRQPKRI
jgi:hypothetical protein